LARLTWRWSESALRCSGWKQNGGKGGTSRCVRSGHHDGDIGFSTDQSERAETHEASTTEWQEWGVGQRRVWSARNCQQECTLLSTTERDMACKPCRQKSIRSKHAVARTLAHTAHSALLPHHSCVLSVYVPCMCCFRARVSARRTRGRNRVILSIAKFPCCRARGRRRKHARATYMQIYMATGRRYCVTFEVRRSSCVR
jgi:hypothetical protein